MRDAKEIQTDRLFGKLVPHAYSDAYVGLVPFPFSLSNCLHFLRGDRIRGCIQCVYSYSTSRNWLVMSIGSSTVNFTL